ncbi:MAG: hypothetical protein AB1634_09825, partial [Thermodesulfobacteriota bacterium]
MSASTQPPPARGDQGHRALLAGWRRLPAASRRFLVFSSVNLISWQCIAGQAMVLFARHLGMPASWVGWLLSFLPLSMLLATGTVRLVERLGPRQLLAGGWLARNLAASLVFTMPWAQAWWGPPGAWAVLLAATLGFCVVRAL